MLKIITTPENEVTKPNAMNSGRVLQVWATDAPRSIGRTGNVQGAATVRVPANRAITAVRIALNEAYSLGVKARRSDIKEPFGRKNRFVTTGLELE